MPATTKPKLTAATARRTAASSLGTRSTYAKPRTAPSSPPLPAAAASSRCAAVGGGMVTALTSPNAEKRWVRASARAEAGGAKPEMKRRTGRPGAAPSSSAFILLNAFGFFCVCAIRCFVQGQEEKDHPPPTCRASPAPPAEPRRHTPSVHRLCMHSAAHRLPAPPLLSTLAGRRAALTVPSPCRARPPPFRSVPHVRLRGGEPGSQVRA